VRRLSQVEVLLGAVWWRLGNEVPLVAERRCTRWRRIGERRGRRAGGGRGERKAVGRQARIGRSKERGSGTGMRCIVSGWSGK